MRFVTTDATISRRRAAAARLPVSPTVTKVLRFSMPSMILRDTRIVTALYDGFSSVPRVTTLAAWSAEVTLAFGQPGAMTGHLPCARWKFTSETVDVSSHLLKGAIMSKRYALALAAALAV